MEARLEPEVARGLRAAREDGTIASQATDEIIGRRAGKFGSGVRAVDNALGWMFRTAEVFNREVAFVTAMRVAKNERKMSYEDAYKYARGIVEETQGVYGKTNLPPFARGDSNWNKAGRAGYAFRHYSNNLFNLWASMLKEGPKGALNVGKSLAAIAAFGGATSIPFIDTFLAAYNKMTGKDGKSELADATGNLVELALYGVPGEAAGVDISGSLGTDVPTSVTDILGPMADWGKRAILTKDSFQAGDYQRMAEDFPLTPAMARNALAATRLATRGMEKRSGKDIKDETGKKKVLDLLPAAKKALGFQPVEVSEIYRKEESAKNITGYWADKADVIRKRLRLSFDKGAGSPEYKEALKDMMEFNKQSPAFFPKIDPKNVLNEKPAKKEVLLKKSVK